MTGASDDPSATARTFLDAVAWAEHTRLWDLLATTARVAVLEVATRRGMDALLAARLRESTASDDERDAFLVDLLHGVRSDLGDIDLDAVRCSNDSWHEDQGGRTVVQLLHDVPTELGGPVPVGAVDLVAEADGTWRVAGVRSW